MAFNNGKPYHGSGAVEGGRLRGRTGRTDYFFFLCPNCNDGQIMRILEYESRTAAPLVERSEKKRPKEPFNLAFHLYCPICQLEDFVKIDNGHRADKLGESLF
jgi:hypothetical protein